MLDNKTLEYVETEIKKALGTYMKDLMDPVVPAPVPVTPKPIRIMFSEDKPPKVVPAKPSMGLCGKCNVVYDAQYGICGCWKSV